MYNGPVLTHEIIRDFWPQYIRQYLCEKKNTPRGVLGIVFITIFLRTFVHTDL